MSSPWAALIRLRSRPLPTGLGAWLLVVLAMGPVGTGAAATGPAVGEATATITWHAPGLQALGLQIVEVEETGAAIRAGGMGFASDGSEALVLDLVAGDFEGVTGGALQLRGGFTVEHAGQSWSLHELRLVAVDPADRASDAGGVMLDVLDAAGERWLRVAAPHFVGSPDGARFRIFNADLLLSEEAASRLGEPALAGFYLGVLDLDLVPAASGRIAPLAAGVEGNPCVDDFSGDVDVVMTDVLGLKQGAREGGRVSMALTAYLQNDGEAAVRWFEAIEPDDLPNHEIGPHPFLVQSFYAMGAGPPVQLGRSDVKHAFFTINTDCTCSPGHVIYPGCRDNYSFTTNLNPLYLAPRSEVQASTGAWERVGSHFDGEPVDDIRDHEGGLDHDLMEHRLSVLESALDLPDTRYFADAWYLVAGDIDILNSMGHTEFDPDLVAQVWVFAEAPEGMASGSVLDRWVDPEAIPPGSTTEFFDSGEGHLQLASQALPVEGAQVQYAYALMNFDYDRQIDSFSIPLNDQVSVSGAFFEDGDSDATNDWTPTTSAEAIVWQAPASAELAWGTLVSFGFEADAPAQDTVASLGVASPGSATALDIDVKGPVALPEPGRGLAMLAGIAMLLVLRRRNHRR